MFSKPEVALGKDWDIYNLLYILKMKKKMGEKIPQLLPFCAVKINILSPSYTAQADGEYFSPYRNHF